MFEILGASCQRSTNVEDSPFVTGSDFTVADIAFTCVLREIRKTEILGKYPHIEKYRHAAKSGRRS